MPNDTDRTGGLTVIDQHPLPTTQEEVHEVYQINPMFDADDDVPHPDTFHDRHMDVLAETREWRIFRAEMYPYSDMVYVWNHQGGYGLRMEDADEQFRGLVLAMMSAAEEVA